MSKSQLIEAAKSGRLAAVEELLQSGADVNERDEQGWTAIKFAAGRGDLSMVELLARHGADPGQAGRDERTPYTVALAAGHAGVARFLREAETRAAGIQGRQPQRDYCRAYRLSELRRFPGWRENAVGGEGDKSGGQENRQTLSDDSIVYLHRDYSVTISIWPGESLIFHDVDQPWREFCRAALGFNADDDLDLVCSKSAGAGA